VFVCVCVCVSLSLSLFYPPALVVVLRGILGKNRVHITVASAVLTVSSPGAALLSTVHHGLLIQLLVRTSIHIATTMGLLRDPVETRSHNSWKNLATCYGRFCVQKRTEEGLYKNTKLRHRWFYVAEDLFPFRIIYSTHPSDFNDALPASSPAAGAATTLFPRPVGEGGITNGTTSGSTSVAGSAAASSVSSTNGKEGLVDTLLHWWSGSGGNADVATTTLASSPSTAATTNFFSPFLSSNSAGPMERFTVATSTQLSGILEAWGLLLEAWEPEEAELNVLSFASPAMASPTTKQAALRTKDSIFPAVVVRVPFLERWRRTYGRISVLYAESGLERSTTTSLEPRTPLSPTLADSVLMSASLAELPLPHTSLPSSRSRRTGGVDSHRRAAASGGDLTPENSGSRSFANRRHVHISDVYYASDSPAPMIAHFFDVLLVRVVDLLMWRDPQLTACCLGILVSVYGHSAWASALCYLAGEKLSASSEYCTALYAHAGDPPATYASAIVSGWVSAERLWWGAPLFMISVLAYPWTGEQQRRVVTMTDRERLRSVDHALRWLSSTPEDNESTITTVGEKEGSGEEDVVAAPCGAAVLLDVVKRVFTVLRASRLPVGVLLLLNVVGAFASWEAIFVLLLWPMLIVGVGLAGIVAVVECLKNP
jgi:hypothetical protein